MSGTTGQTPFHPAFRHNGSELLDIPHLSHLQKLCKSIKVCAGLDWRLRAGSRLPFAVEESSTILEPSMNNVKHPTIYTDIVKVILNHITSATH